MAKFRIAVEGDTQEELVEALGEALTMLGAEAAPAEETTEETGGDADDLLGGGEDDNEALRETIKDKVVKISKKPEGADKIRAVFKKVKANRLQDVPDDKLTAVDGAMDKLAKELKVKL